MEKTIERKKEMSLTPLGACAIFIFGPFFRLTVASPMKTHRRSIRVRNGNFSGLRLSTTNGKWHG
ncbi:MAG: hypothetical protein Q8N89_10180 [Azonexus sp.]|nr:hypothetical protein [Azonexus sp.]